MYEFETPKPVTVRSRSGAGTVTVSAADVTTTTIELTALRGSEDELRAIDEATVVHTGDSLNIDVGRDRHGWLKGKPQIGVALVVPTGSVVNIEAASADISVAGSLQALAAKTGSGDLTIERADNDTNLKTGSGDVQISSSNGRLVAATGSGDVQVGSSDGVAALSAGSGTVSAEHARGDFTAKTGSGNVVIRDGGGQLTMKAGSGDLSVKSVADGAVLATTGSGDVDIAVVSGTAAWLDLNTVTGTVRNRLDDATGPDPDEKTVELRVKTATGDISISRA